MKQTHSTAWNQASKWYAQIVSQDGHYFHQRVIFPQLKSMLDLTSSDSVIDLGCGNGVFGQHIPKACQYLGIDASSQLIKIAQKHDSNPRHTYLTADLTQPCQIPTQFTAAVCILALQNMSEPDQCILTAAKALHTGGKLALVLNHPAFRIPRQTSWGIDQQTTLQYRRINRYFQPLKIPVDVSPGAARSSMTWSFHFPLSSYFSALKQAGFVVLDLQEWCSDKKSAGKAAKMENRARSEFPLFLCILAQKAEKQNKLTKSTG